jgi:nitronate monooxygenase
MSAWPDRRLTELLAIEHPILQAPMAGAMDWRLAAAVAATGALGAIPCAMLDAAQVRAEVAAFRAQVRAPVHLNFFCHAPPAADAARDAAWRARLAPYYRELGVDPAAAAAGGARRAPIDDAMIDVVIALGVEIVSFHFGTPPPAAMDRLRAAGCRLLASATTVAEARELAGRGVDAIIAQGLEAGGHRGMFLTDDVAAQVGTFALVPQIADAVAVPVIAAGGVADGRGVAAALALGAAGVAIGTAYLRCDEATIAAVHRAALAAARDDGTAITNVITGRPARGVINRLIREVGPLAADTPAFPLASTAVQPLRAAAERAGSGDFSPMWAGQAAALARPGGAGAITRAIIADAQARLGADAPASLAEDLHRLELSLLDPARRAAPASLADLLADDYVEHGASGRTYDKAQTLAALAPIAAPRVSDFRARPLGRDRALVTYRIDKDDAPSLRSSIWERRGAAGWQIVFHQGTPIGAR